MCTLGDTGFDATWETTSLKVVEPPPQRPDVAPHQARRRMEATLFVPISPAMRGSEMDRLTAAIANRVARRVSVGPTIELRTDDHLESRAE
jgi:hypothetical protein